MIIDKPLEFLGAYVVSADISIGINGDSSFLNLVLVEDPIHNKMFQPPEMGTACLFEFGELKFGGLFRRSEYNEAIGGRNYSVVIESPNTIVQGVSVITDIFQGTIYTDDKNIDNLSSKPIMTYGGDYPTNIINILADKENYEYGGSFGNADLDSRGYPIARIRDGSTITIFDDIESAVSSNNFGGKIKFGNTDYIFDFSQIKPIAKQFNNYRLNNPFGYLQDIVSEVCDVGMCDFSFELTGTANQLGIIESDATIIIKIFPKTQPPVENALQSVIADIRNGKNNIVSYSTGKELSEVESQRVIFGGAASRYWLAGRNYMIPIWGSTFSGRNSVYQLGNSVWEYNNPFTEIVVTNQGAAYEGSFTRLTTTLLELRCALSGRECWAAYHLLMAIKNGKNSIVIGNIKFQADELSLILNNKFAPVDMMNTDLDDAQILAEHYYGYREGGVFSQEIVNARYNTILAVAEQYYGSQFLVSVPGEPGGTSNSFRWIQQDQKQEDAWSLAQSAWAGDDSSRYFPDTWYYDTDGKMQAVAIFPYYENIDYSPLGSEYGRTPYGTNFGVVTQAEVDTEWGIRWLDLSLNDIDQEGKRKKDSAGNEIVTTLSYGLAKVRIPTLYIYDEYTTSRNGFNMLCKLILGMDMLPSNHNMYGFDRIDFPLHPSAVVPEYVGIPQVSNRYVWGPWFSFNRNTGQKGKVKIETDDKLTPEYYGSIAAMNAAANNIINSDINNLTNNETGFLELAESPTFNLGNRFAGYGPYVLKMNLRISADTNGWITRYEFGNWTKSAGKLSRYNLESINGLRKSNFELRKSVFDTFKRPPFPRVSFSPIGEFIAKPQEPSMDMIMGHMMNTIAYSINQLGGGFPRTNTHMMPMNAAMRGAGLNFAESFGATFEQFFTPVFTYNQNQGSGVVQDFNKELNK